MDQPKKKAVRQLKDYLREHKSVEKMPAQAKERGNLKERSLGRSEKAVRNNPERAQELQNNSNYIPPNTRESSNN